MIEIKAKNIIGLMEFLTIVNKFAPQCLFNVGKEKTEIFCKNQAVFASSRFDTITDLLTLDEKCKYDNVMLCIRDINAFKDALNIVALVEEGINSIVLDVEEFVTPEQEVYGRKINYKGKTKFSLITVDRDVIQSYISQAVKADIESDMVWSFYIDPYKLDIVQSRTNNIVDKESEVSIYFDINKETKEVECSLVAKKSTYNNAISIPIANEYEGSLDNVNLDICLSEPSFRIANILRVGGPKDLKCSFNNRYNFLKFDSAINEEDYYIKSTVITGIVKGK